LPGNITWHALSKPALLIAAALQSRQAKASFVNR
jgi:hypothetical protein